MPTVRLRGGEGKRRVLRFRQEEILEWLIGRGFDSRRLHHNISFNDYCLSTSSYMSP